MKKITSKQIFAFDMDGTLTNSRLDKVSDEVRKSLRELKKNGLDVVILSSGSIDRLYNQIEDVDLHIIGNYGYTEADIIGGRLVNNKTNLPSREVDEQEVASKVDRFRLLTGNTDVQGKSYIINKYGMIIVPLPGNELSNDARNYYDPEGTKRRQFVDQLQSEFPDSNVYICGKTSYDIVDKDINKYTALKRYCDNTNRTLDDVMFFGDEFDNKDGNDYCLKENGVEGINVSSPNEICKLIDIVVDNIYNREHNAIIDGFDNVAEM